MSAITKLLPRKKVSQWVGAFVHWNGPRWWARFSIRLFAGAYKINLDEAEFSIDRYCSIGDFFVRRLKPGLRPVGSGWALHPADSVISQCGEIKDSSLIQAKGIFYSLQDLTQDSMANTKWNNGFFATYYLCPTDYHRVHSPVSGLITKVELLSGDLWPVNDWSTSHIPNLFGVNERVLVEIQTELGPVAVIFVGATNVGSIILSFEERIRGNDKNSEKLIHYPSDPQDANSVFIQKGQELGMFRMGSTVVMLYSELVKNRMFESGHSINKGQVRVNQTAVQ